MAACSALLDEIGGYGSEEIAVCAVCLGEFRDPRLLPCLHTFCRACIDNLTANLGTPRGGRLRPSMCVSCPICRSNCTLPNGTADGLPVDVSVMCEEANTAAGACAVCEEQSSSDDESGGARRKSAGPTWWCETCKLPLCYDHLGRHMTLPGTHTVNQSSEAKRPPRMCSVHGEPLKYLCTPCDREVCGDCVAVGRHAGHHIALISKIMEKRNKFVEEQTGKFRDQTVPSLQRSIAEVEDVTSRLEARADEVTADIEAARERAVAAVEECFARKLQEVDDLKTARCKHLYRQKDDLARHLKNVQGAVKFSGRLSAAGGCKDSAMLALERRMRKLNREEIQQTPVCHPCVEFEAADCSLLTSQGRHSDCIGKVIPRHGSALRSVVRGDPHSTREFPMNECVELTLEVRDKDGKLVKTEGDCIETKWMQTTVRRTSHPAVEIAYTNGGLYEISFRLEKLERICWLFS